MCKKCDIVVFIKILNLMKNHILTFASKRMMKNFLLNRLTKKWFENTWIFLIYSRLHQKRRKNYETSTLCHFYKLVIDIECQFETTETFLELNKHHKIFSEQFIVERLFKEKNETLEEFKSKIFCDLCKIFVWNKIFFKIKHRTSKKKHMKKNIF